MVMPADQERYVGTWRAALNAAARPGSRATRVSAAATTTSALEHPAAATLTAKIFPAHTVVFVHQDSKATPMCNALVSLLTEAPVGVTYANSFSFCVV